jgi:NAD+ diphosphatase
MLRTPDTFIPLLTPETHANSLVFIFRSGELLVRESDLALPDTSAGLPHGLQTEDMHPLGLWQSQYCCTTALASEVEAEPGFVFKSLRELFGVFDEQLLGLASRAAQIVEWVHTHQYCGACANPMQLAVGERAFQCSACGHIAYPRISPAMMVLIKKGDAILLAHHGRSPSGRFSPLAGFLEAGESIEDAIHREVMEEVGLKVNNITYFGSQSWPFPHSLMIAFTADYVSGEICVDGEEITEARWFGPLDDLPDTYPEISISGHLVNAHMPRQK